MNKFTVISISLKNAQNLVYALNCLNALQMGYEADTTSKDAIQFVFEELTDKQETTLLETLQQNNIIYEIN